MEYLLQGEAKTGWNKFKSDKWLEFFHSFFRLTNCKSKLIITSQDYPNQFQLIKNSEKFVDFHVTGLTEIEQLQLFSKVGLEFENASNRIVYIQRIGRAYEGHPLALLVIAGEILDPLFAGNIEIYWERNKHDIIEIERIRDSPELQNANDRMKLDRLSKTLKQFVRVKIEKSLMRLKLELPNAYYLLCITSCFRKSVEYKTWIKPIQILELDTIKLIIAMESLIDRFLIEIEKGYNEKDLYRQHNIIRSITLQHTNRLILGDISWQ